MVLRQKARTHLVRVDSIVRQLVTEHLLVSVLVSLNALVNVILSQLGVLRNTEIQHFVTTITGCTNPLPNNTLWRITAHRAYREIHRSYQKLC